MQRAAWWMEARDDARGRRLRHLGSYAADDSDEMSTTTIALIASVSTLMVVLLLYLACRMNARLHKRHHDLRREVRRIQATRAVMERSKQSSYHSTHDGETGVSVGLGHVQLAHDVRFDPNFAHTRIPHHELHNLRFVAKGSGTVVFQAVFNNVVIAVKQLLPSQCGSLLIVSDFMREIRLAATLEHPNIVGFVGLAWTEGSSLADLSLLTEFMPNGKLDHVHHNMAVATMLHACIWGIIHGVVGEPWNNRCTWFGFVGTGRGHMQNVFNLGDLMGFLKYEKKTPAADRRLRPTWDAPNPLATPASSIRTTFSNGGHSSSRHRMRREMIEQGTSKASLAAEVADALAYLHSFQPTVGWPHVLSILLRVCAACG
ncbi:TKL protein kinase, variant 2 [Aphanomyces invadans]|uniref:TKL protein kinase, variant 2 n=1 Tax=Aphanomyces invadans TaxID=157072 RepID=A0A024TFY5_9STRA|nr:TKL protein kinase, variant 2 [Aphanomyces invadans]ETV92938.1 TKL protein kinase, variant 2 [Aphanomyces invadans]|eukprot:XP_008878461.1 TKL protein kinase, variant 2 [Aphanomyces invadans]